MKRKIILLSIMCMLILFACSKKVDKESGYTKAETNINEGAGTESVIDDEKSNSLNEEMEYWQKMPLEISEDGNTCYVLDYYGGQLDKKYLKFKKLDFSKNNGKHIKTVRGMFSLMVSDIDANEKKHYSEDIEVVGEGYDYDKNFFLNLEEVDLTGLDLSECIDMSEMFAYCKNLKRVNFSNLDTKNVKSMYKMFHRCDNLEIIENFNIDTSNVEEMDGMFFYCKNLKNVDFSSFTANNLLYMDYMFYKCENIENIDLKNFMPDKCIDFKNAFMLNKKLKTINLSNFNTKSGNDFSYMFYGAENLENIDLSKFDISNAITLEKMFYGCKNIEGINFSENHMSQEEINMTSMFEKMDKIKNIDLSKIYSDKPMKISNMFRDCFLLEDIDISNIDLLESYDTDGMFDGCGEIKNVKINDTIDTVNNSDKKIIRQISFVKNYEINHTYCERRNKIYNRDLINTTFDGWNKLVNNEFSVVEYSENGWQYDNSFKEFFEIYEINKYNEFPNFVTTDSMLHTYHLYFDFLMKKIEKEVLLDKIINISKVMYQMSKNYEYLLKGTDWDIEANLLKAYFAVPIKIFDEKFVVDDDIKNIVDNEINLINEHTEQRPYNPIFEKWAHEYEENFLDTSMFMDDYTQYKPRGHYDGDEQLEKYFKVFMWYGRTNFKLTDEHLTKMAILMSITFNDSYIIEEYNNIKNVIYYFAGDSDDRSPVEYIDIIEKTYGTKSFDKTKILDKSYYDKFCDEAKKLPLSIINSAPGVPSVVNLDKNNNVNFRFIGQTYTYDAEIFKKLTYDYVKQYIDENGEIKIRLLPDFLDVPASLNSKIAEKILKEEDNFKYPNFESNLRELQKEMPFKIESDSSNILYVKWIRTLKKLIDSDENNEYPSFMKNEEWKKKKLETFGGSYAELKHDTILYSKQSYSAEMGEGGSDEFYDVDFIKYDDKGYVEPEKEVYMGLYRLAIDTLNSFSSMGMLDDTMKEFLTNFSELSMKLYNISEKELSEQNLSDEDYELIKNYGGIIEHLITDSGVYEYTSDDSKKSNAIVADIATGGNNALEIATGNPIKVYVLIEVDGKYKICSGGVYDFYQFEINAENRMTDKEWRVMMGFEHAYSYDDMDNEDSSLKSIKEGLKFHEWTKSYRYQNISNSPGQYTLYKIGGEYY